MLSETVFRTDDVAVADRFDYWRELIGRTHAPSEMSSDHAADFRASMRVLDLGASHMWTATLHPMRFQRTPRLIRRSDPELLHLNLLLHGGIGIEQAGRQAVCRRHDLYLVDTSHPYDCHVLDQRQQVTGVSIEVPKALLHLPGKGAEPLLGRGLPAREGISAMLAQFLTRVIDDSPVLQPPDGPRLGTAAVELLSALLTHELADADALPLPSEDRRRTLTLRIQAFIQQHLGEPQLSPPAIAAAHHISVSYLHRLFAASGTTVSTWIRSRRLERARSDLANPALDHLPVHQVAAHWGFSEPAVFSRAFRSAYGLAPRDYRHRALSALPSRSR